MIEAEASSEQKAAAARRALARRLDGEREALRSGRISPVRSAAASLLAALDVDGRAMGLTVREACDALLPYRLESAATKRTARAVRKAYEARWTEIEQLPPVAVVYLCEAAIASLTEAETTSPALAS